MLKKILTLLYVREKKRDLIKKKFLPKLNCPYPPPQQKSHGQTHREWGKRRIWHVSKCHPSTKWLARIHHVVVFKTKVLSNFKIENMPIKDTNGKKKFKRMLSFLSVDKPELFAMKLSFKEFTLVFFTADQSAWLILNQPRFVKKLEVHSVYSMVKESTFLKGNLCIYKGFMDLQFYVFTLAWKKTTKCAFEIDFLPSAQPI